jgi:hypothetical protein
MDHSPQQAKVSYPADVREVAMEDRVFAGVSK